VVTATDGDQPVIEIEPADPAVILCASLQSIMGLGPALLYPYPGWYWGSGIGFGFGIGIDVGFYFGGGWRGWGGIPLLANLFLHYAFDRWMAKQYPQMPFDRYADDAIVHGRSGKPRRFGRP
jgi:hypothetical protein